MHRPVSAFLLVAVRLTRFAEAGMQRLNQNQPVTITNLPMHGSKCIFTTDLQVQIGVPEFRFMTPQPVRNCPPSACLARSVGADLAKEASAQTPGVIPAAVEAEG